MICVINVHQRQVFFFLMKLFAQLTRAELTGLTVLQHFGTVQTYPNIVCFFESLSWVVRRHGTRVCHQEGKETLTLTDAD